MTFPSKTWLLGGPHDGCEYVARDCALPYYLELSHNGSVHCYVQMQMPSFGSVRFVHAGIVRKEDANDCQMSGR